MLINPYRFTSSTPVSNLWTPEQLGSSVLWLDAMDENSVVHSIDNVITQLQDKSTANNHFYPVTGIPTPLYSLSNSISNNKPAIVFPDDGNARFVQAASAFNLKEVFYVCAYKDGLASTFARYDALLSGTQAYGAPRIIGDLDKNSIRRDGTTFGDYIYKNGSTTSSITVLPMPLSILRVKSDTLHNYAWVVGGTYGYTDVNHWKGVICEVIGFPSSLTTGEAQKVEGYLAHKWGLAGELPAAHPYKNSPPTNYVLDNIEDVIDVFSFKRASSEYSGDILKVRRASDNTYASFGLSGDAFEKSAMETFLNGSNGFGSRWYSQSGSNRYLLSEENTSYQPKIANNGTMYTSGLLFDGNDDYFELADIDTAQIGICARVNIATYDGYDRYIVHKNNYEGWAFGPAKIDNVDLLRFTANVSISGYVDVDNSTGAITNSPLVLIAGFAGDSMRNRINGVETTGAPEGDFAQNNEPIVVGHCYDSGFHGYIDFLLLKYYDFTSTEIAWLENYLST